jgi:hypothetical protein
MRKLNLFQENIAESGRGLVFTDTTARYSFHFLNHRPRKSPYGAGRGLPIIASREAIWSQFQVQRESVVFFLFLHDDFVLIRTTGKQVSNLQ